MNKEDPFALLRQMQLHPLAQDYLHHVKVCAAYDMPPSATAIFTDYHEHFCQKPTPQFNALWSETSPNWRWQKAHVSSVFDSVQAATAAVYYHSDNIKRIEREIKAFPKLKELLGIMNNAAMGGGNTRKLDFEYHAFVLAFRRTLDYLARAVSALVKSDFHSYRTLPKGLARHTDKDWVQRAIEVHQKHMPYLGSFISTSDVPSNRDRISHYENIPAGCVNVNAMGIFLAGGGEHLDAQTTLAFVIENNIKTMLAILTETLSAIKLGHPKQCR